MAEIKNNEINQTQMAENGEECKLPEDIITEHILPRVPIKPLTQFKVVSKDWYSLISSSNFIDKHYKLSLFSDNNAFTPIESLLIKSNDQFLLYNGVNLFKLNVNFMIGSHKVLLKGCSKGLVCLAELHGKFFILWNPTMNIFQKFYPPDFDVFVKSNVKPYCNWGFGYVSSEDDYKTVRVVLGMNEEVTSVHVHSLKLNTWKKIVSGFEHIPVMLLGQPQLVNEIVYWTLIGVAIIAFDLKSETFYRLPPCMDVDVKPGGGFLCVLGGCLGACNTNSNNDLVITIYKGCGNVCCGNVASVRLPSDASLYDYRGLIGFTRNGMICVAQRNPKRIAFIGGPTLKKTALNFHDNGDLSMESYVPTHTSPIPSGVEPNASKPIPASIDSDD